MLCCQNRHATGCVVNGYNNEDLLFDASLITEMDWSSHTATFHDDISPQKPGRNLVMRPLSVDDYDRGVCQCFLSVSEYCLYKWKFMLLPITHCVYC